MMNGRDVERGSQTTSMSNLGNCLYKLMKATENVWDLNLGLQLATAFNDLWNIYHFDESYII